MVRRDLAARKIARAAAWMADAEPILRGPVEDGYAGVDHRRLHAESREGLEALRQFFAAAAEAARI